MKPQYQLHDYGCFQACIATITDRFMCHTPDFYRDGAENFGKLMKKWNKNNKHFLLLDIPFSEGRKSKILVEVPLIVTGTSPRDNTMLHSVIYKNWELIHDPYEPDQIGIVEPCIITLVFTKSKQ